MWVLLIFTMFVDSGPGGGAHSTVTPVQFSTQAICQAAAQTLAENGNVPNAPNAFYKIWGKCIQKD